MSWSADSYPHLKLLEASSGRGLRFRGDSLVWLESAAEDVSLGGSPMQYSQEVLLLLRALSTRCRRQKFDQAFWSKVESLASRDRDLVSYPKSHLLAALFPLLDHLTKEQSDRRLWLGKLYFQTSAAYDWYYHFLTVSSPEYLALRREIRALAKMWKEESSERVRELMGDRAARAALNLEPRYPTIPFPDPLYPPAEVSLTGYLNEVLFTRYADNCESFPNYSLNRNVRRTPRSGCDVLCPECQLYVEQLYQKNVCYNCYNPS